MFVLPRDSLRLLQHEVAWCFPVLLSIDFYFVARLWFSLFSSRTVVEMRLRFSSLASRGFCCVAVNLVAAQHIEAQCGKLHVVCSARSL